MSKQHDDHADDFNEAMARFDAAEAAKAAKDGREAHEAGQDGQDGAQTPEDGAQAPAQDAEGTPDGQDGQDGQEGAEGGQDDAQSPNHEAAKYRRRLREAEKERDELRTRLDVYLARDVEQVASGFLDSPALLWADGKASAGDFLDEKGEVDRAKVKASAEAILSRFGRGLASRRGTAPNEGRGRTSASGPFYRDAFAPKREI